MPATKRPAREPSEFSQLLSNHTDLAARCDVIAKSIQESASEELKDLERSEQLTKDDLAVYINARSDSLISETDD